MKKILSISVLFISMLLGACVTRGLEHRPHRSRVHHNSDFYRNGYQRQDCRPGYRYQRGYYSPRGVNYHPAPTQYEIMSGRHRY